VQHPSISCFKLTANEKKYHYQYPAGIIAPNFNFCQVLLARMMGKPLYKDRVISYCGALADSQKRTPKGLVYIDDYGPLPKIATAAYICFQVTVPTDYQKYSIMCSYEMVVCQWFCMGVKHGL
jgi:hypothetical protein